MKPQNKGDIVTLLGQVRKALTVKTYRNNYEDKNAFESNIERLAVCEVHLGDSCTGVITDSEERQRLMTEVVELRKALCEKHYPNGVGVVFVKDLHGAKGQCIMEECRFLKEMEAHADNEVEEDEEMLPRGKNKNFENKKKDKNNKKKKKSNIENDINNKLVDKVQHNSNETTVEKACNPNTNPLSNIDGCKYITNVRDGKNETPALRSPCTNINDILSTSNVFATYHNCLFSDLDRSALLSSCTATPVKNSPLIELTYDTLVPFSNKEIPAKYCLSMYRVVAAALWRGPPKEHVGEQKQSTSISTSDIYNPYLSHEAVGNVEINDDEAFLFLEEDDGDDEEESIRKALEKNSTDVTSASQISDFDVIRDVTEALAQQYVEDAWLQELQQETRGTPSVISNSTVHFLEATAAPWVVLMCHGGYFAGAVFINRIPVVHKCFQRYVVRKKAGGKQSKCDKTGGCMSSIGSQIRRANELKWKLLVRDILLGWRRHIESAWLVLYVTPGSDNRNIITNFEDLPGSKQFPKSPIDIKDPRVQPVPLTTHRPCFKEVTRIYEIVSKVTVKYTEPHTNDKE